MKKRCAAILTAMVFLLSGLAYSCAESGGASSIRDMVITERKAFSFRNGVTWGMNPQQVMDAENVAMDLRSSSEWSVMITSAPVAVSRFAADLVYMFYQDALRMITYEFQKENCTSLNYQYLTGALCSVYGDSKDANPLVIKSWMDRIYQDYYRQEKIARAKEWSAEDGTSIFLYYYTEDKYAILYICPVSSSTSGYDTNGL